MFDVGFWELCLIAVLALLILGPERLPRVARTAGLWLGKARRFMADVKADIDSELNREELRAIQEMGEDLKGAAQDLQDAGKDLNANAVPDDDLVEAINESAPSTTPELTDQAADKADAASKKNVGAG